MKSLLSKISSDLLLVGILGIFSLSISVILQPDCESASFVEVADTGSSNKSISNEVRNPVLSLNQLRNYLLEEPTPILIDARKASTYRRGHIPSAISIPGNDFSNNYDLVREQLEPYKAQLVVVYCDSAWCGTASDVQSHLVARGFENVGIFIDGIRKWREEELPEERG